MCGYWLFAERHHAVDDAGGEDEPAAYPRAQAQEAHEERWQSQSANAHTK